MQSVLLVSTADTDEEFSALPSEEVTESSDFEMSIIFSEFDELDLATFGTGGKGKAVLSGVLMEMEVTAVAGDISLDVFPDGVMTLELAMLITFFDFSFLKFLIESFTVPRVCDLKCGIFFPKWRA